MPELGEYARGILVEDHLTVRVPASAVADAEGQLLRSNQLEKVQRALMCEGAGGRLAEDLGWGITVDYVFVKAAPGLVE